MAEDSVAEQTDYIQTLFWCEPAPPDRKRAHLKPLPECDAPLLKRCSTCRDLKPLTAYARARGFKFGASYQCKACFNARQRKKWRSCEKTRALSSDRHRSLRYGLSPEAFQSMLDEQGGRCSICQAKLRPGKQTHVDHCHATGRVRSLLCHPCNVGLAVVENHPGRVERFKAYLKTHAGDRNPD